MAVDKQPKIVILFNAFKLYGMMPADRRRITIVGQGANGMASASPTCVTAVVWNTQSDEKTVKITLNNIPFASGRLEVYHIDESRRFALASSRAE